MTIQRSARRSAIIMLAIAGGLALAACKPAASVPPAGAEAGASRDLLGAAPGSTASPEPPTPQTGPETEPESGPGSGGAGPTDIAVSFPGTAKAYAQAVVTAWKQGQVNTLGSLTTPGVQEQLLEIPQPLNDAWSYLRCDGTAGSSYCLFVNADGDELTLRISHPLLGKAHAATEVTLDLTAYPADGVAYVKEFVAAWQIGNTTRMLKLSKPSVVDQLGTAPVNPSYPEPDCCGGGLLQVKVAWAATSVRFDVGTTLLGEPHAIVGYAKAGLSIRVS